MEKIDTCMCFCTLVDCSRKKKHAKSEFASSSSFFFFFFFVTPSLPPPQQVENKKHHFEKIPVLSGDPRFVYHNPGTDEWFGQVQGGELRYEERGRWFGPKKLDKLGNFILGRNVD
jgi:hypothetical protein